MYDVAGEHKSNVPGECAADVTWRLLLLRRMPRASSAGSMVWGGRRDCSTQRGCVTARFKYNSTAQAQKWSVVIIVHANLNA